MRRGLRDVPAPAKIQFNSLPGHTSDTVAAFHVDPAHRAALHYASVRADALDRFFEEYAAERGDSRQVTMELEPANEEKPKKQTKRLRR